jgi:RNA polymerase sigma-70 factor (ECF subfamily)
VTVIEGILSRGEEAAARGGDESRLLERCRAGDARATEELVRLHGSAVHRFAHRLLGDPEEARDLTQEVFLRAFRRLGSFRADSSLRTWLFRITLNAARNRRRSWSRHRRSRTVSLEANPGEEGQGAVARLAHPAPGPDRALEGRTIRARLAEALEELPEEFRVAVSLRDVEGLDYRSIARITGVRVGTVKSRIGRAREALRARLADLRPAAREESR